MVFGIDFDNTIATHNYPFVGELIPMAKEVINTLVDNGHTVMLWTVRGNEAWDPEGKINAMVNAIEFLEQNEIDVQYFNESPIHPSSSPKQLVDYFIDDINLGTPLRIYKGRHLVVDWLAMCRHLFMVKAITQEQWNNLRDIAYERYPDVWDRFLEHDV